MIAAAAQTDPQLGRLAHNLAELVALTEQTEADLIVFPECALSGYGFSSRSEGWAAAADGYAQPDVSSPALLGEYNRVISQYVARTGRSLDHMQNFLDCIRSRERTVANPEVMHHSMTTVHAANICMWLKRSLKFDPVKEEFVGDEEANRLCSRAMREPYVY